MKQSLGSYGAAGQLQQEPAPAVGGIYHRDWWRYYEAFPQFIEETIQSWDLTFKSAAKGDVDYVVGQVWGRKGADYYLLDQVRGQWDFVQTLDEMLKLNERWPKAHLKLIEDKANGPAVISVLKNQVGGIVPVEPYLSKEARAYAVSPYVESGHVYLPARAEWVGPFVDRCAKFPRVDHDDEIDAMNQAITRFTMAAQIPRDAAKALSSARIL
jgi:predicted phage terminase large subunit-like protein